MHGSQSISLSLAARKLERGNTIATTDTATIEELCVTFPIAGVWDSGVWERELSASFSNTVFSAPFDCIINSADFVREYGSLSGSTNTLTITLIKTDVNGVSTNIVSQSTADKPMNSRENWTFDNALWDTAAAKLNKGDILRFSASCSGSGTFRAPSCMTVRYVPNPTV